MFKIIISLFFVFLILSKADDSDNLSIIDKNFKVSLSWLENKPKSYTKDFFIIQYLNNSDITLEDAKKAFDMAKRKSGRVKKAFNKKFNQIPKEDLICYRTKTADLIKLDDKRCIALGLSIYDGSTLSQKTLQKVILKLNDYPTLKNDLKIISSDQPFLELQDVNIERFYRIFFNVSKTFRLNEINHPMSSNFIKKIAEHKMFNKFIRLVTSNDNLISLQKSLFNVPNNKFITHNSMFLLAINALKYEKEDVALKYFDAAYNKAYFQMDKDNVIFWKYLITKNEEYLTQLSQSWDNNIYSLYAKEILSISPNNIIHNIELLNTPTNYDILDNFSWIKVLDDTKINFDEVKLRKYYNLFTDKTTLPHYAYVLERFHKYRKQYFITPYESIIKNYPLDKQILIYSISKQESRFIPSSVSFATAQGMMQIMPFLSKSLANELKEPYNIYEQFLPKKNIKYASKHLDKLVKQFNNKPLFIAYAYNGGAGFTRKQFKRGLFQKKGKYEPFLSMELIAYSETKRYGKKVLANYYIYNNYLKKNEKVKLSTIFENLTFQH